jgi:hypothetical protein
LPPRLGFHPSLETPPEDPESRAIIDELKEPDALSSAMLSKRVDVTGLSDESRIVASTDQVSSDLAGDAAILNLKSGVYYGLDPVGAHIWSLIQEPVTFAQIRDALLDYYDVEKSRLESDLRDLLGQLAEHGLVEIRP